MASGRLKDAPEPLGLAPALVTDEENLELRDACEPMLPIKFRSVKAIKKIYELRGKLDLLNPVLRPIGPMKARPRDAKGTETAVTCLGQVWQESRHQWSV